VFAIIVVCLLCVLCCILARRRKSGSYNRAHKREYCMFQCEYYAYYL
jgi:hypothetical protein